MKLTGPDATPVPVNGVFFARRMLTLTPEPEPPLKSLASVRIRSMMDSIESRTVLMKQALHCGSSLTPTLNQTGELKAPI